MKLPEGFVHATRLDESTMRLVRADGSRLVVSLGRDGRMWVDVIRAGEPTHRRVFEPRQVTSPARGGRDTAEPDGGLVRSPTSGVLRECPFRAGDPVARDTVVAVVEAMKMRIEVRAGASGTVSAVRAVVGDRVERGAVLIAIDASPGAATAAR